jgi:hypothetical protein
MKVKSTYPLPDAVEREAPVTQKAAVAKVSKNLRLLKRRAA